MISPFKARESGPMITTQYCIFLLKGKASIFRVEIIAFCNFQIVLYINLNSVQAKMVVPLQGFHQWQFPPLLFSLKWCSSSLLQWVYQSYDAQIQLPCWSADVMQRLSSTVLLLFQNSTFWFIFPSGWDLYQIMLQMMTIVPCLADHWCSSMNWFFLPLFWFLPLVEILISRKTAKMCISWRFCRNECCIMSTYVFFPPRKHQRALGISPPHMKSDEKEGG